jgi:hypothetical protein
MKKMLFAALLLATSFFGSAQSQVWIQSGLGVSNFREQGTSKLIVGQSVGIHGEDRYTEHFNMTMGVDWKRKGFHDRDANSILSINFVNLEMGVQYALKSGIRIGVGGYFAGNVATTAIVEINGETKRFKDDGNDRIYDSGPGAYAEVLFMRPGSRFGASLQYDNGLVNIASNGFNAHPNGLFLTALYRIYKK